MPRWNVHDTRVLHDGDSVRLEEVDLELPDGRRGPHAVVRILVRVVAVVVRRENELLLLWRHRFITDEWVWDVPAGKIAEGESVEAAAVRAAVDETGWRPANVRRIGAYRPSAGISDQLIEVCIADGAELVAEPSPVEADRVEWVPVESIDLATLGGVSLTAVLWARAG